MSPILYLQEKQINSLFRDHKGSEKVIDGEAYSSDGNSVFHAFTERGSGRMRGARTAIKFVLLPSTDKIEHLDTDNPLAKYRSSKEPSLFVFFAIEENALKHRGYFSSAADTVPCQIKFVPDKSDLYSRSKGLLETNVWPVSPSGSSASVAAAHPLPLSWQRLASAVSS